MRCVLVLLLAAAQAGSALSAETDPCAPLARQQDRNECISHAVERADAGLGRMTDQLKVKLDANGRRNLAAANRAWLVFRERECEFRSGYDTEHLENNGTLAPFLVGECKLDLARRRKADLRKQLKCPGGDLSCPQ